MMIKKSSFFEILLPLLIICFICQQISLFNSVVSVNTRWILLLVLFLYILCGGQFLKGLSLELRITLLLYLTWCMFTVFWSEVPMLSCVKAGAMIVTSITLTSAGLLWVNKFQWQNSLNWIIMLLVVTLLTGVLGRGNESAINQMNGLDAYQGLANNTNYFGCLQAMILPLLLWQVYKNWSQGNKKFVWVGLLVLSVVFLIQSYSRASLLMAACIVILFISSFPIKKKVVISAITLLLVMTILSALSFSIGKLIYKNHDNDLLQTRRDVWAESYSQAILGGWVGAGFAVNVGESVFHLNNLSSAE